MENTVDRVVMTRERCFLEYYEAWALALWEFADEDEAKIIAEEED